MVRMRKFQILAVVSLILLGVLPAQEKSAPAKFAGTWQATFKGAVFCTLRIEAGREITGTLSPGRITVNDEGDLTDAEASTPDGTFPILNAKAEGQKLTFEWKERGDSEVMRFELRLTGKNEAEIRVTRHNDIKPIRLRRAG